MNRKHKELVQVPKQDVKTKMNIMLNTLDPYFSLNDVYLYRDTYISICDFYELKWHVFNCSFHIIVHNMLYEQLNQISPYVFHVRQEVRGYSYKVDAERRLKSLGKKRADAKKRRVKGNTHSTIQRTR